MRSTNDQRLLGREAQTRSWAAPLPDFTAMPRANEPIRQRVEWNTRDTMNQRLWTDLQSQGSKEVTPAMLAAHPTAGASPMMPSVSRTDQRNYIAGPSYFPSAPVGQREKLPARSLFQNAWTAGFDVDGDAQNIGRELRGVVKETRGSEVAGSLAVQRMFQHQWLSPEISKQVIAVAERPRPTQDDYRVDYMTHAGPQMR